MALLHRLRAVGLRPIDLRTAGLRNVGPRAGGPRAGGLRAGSPRTRGVAVGRWILITLALAALAATIVYLQARVPIALRPDQVLRDSLALTDADAVHAIELRVGDGHEQIVPDSVKLAVGDHLQFIAGDGFVHLVHFDTTRVSPEQRRWLDAVGARVGPALLNRDSRWVIDFDAAPIGRYPFMVEGNLEPGRGTVIVAERR